jgi:hypothetical protein
MRKGKVEGATTLKMKRHNFYLNCFFFLWVYIFWRGDTKFNINSCTKKYYSLPLHGKQINNINLAEQPR